MAYRIGNTPASATRELAWAAAKGHYAEYLRLSPGVAEALRDARLLQGMSLRETARLAGISAGFLSRLERGLRAPRDRVALALVAVLDLEDDLAEALLEETASPRG